MSDLTPIADQVKIGVATDCPTNPVCGEALQEAYGIDVANATLLSACDTPMVQAIQAGTVDVGELCSTQPEIQVNGWVILEDDKNTQPAENIAPLVRNSLLTALGTDKDAFEQILNDVSAKMTTETLTDLGKQIQIDKKDIAVVAKAWLQANGFVS
jgi:osmoprotectant transport system substrate-binding protein